MDNVGDLKAATAFPVKLGLELEGEALNETKGVGRHVSSGSTANGSTWR
ncbi:hypothetical protein [Nonomuraea jabiensis]